NPNPPYAGYVLGYNRSVLAERAHDLLTVIAWARGWGQREYVIAFPGAAPGAMLARAAAGDDVVAGAAMDLGGFDFDQIRSDSDEMLLPGALKYGGTRGVLPLCATGRTVICGAARTVRD